jgi:hypothetical protein
MTAKRGLLKMTEPSELEQNHAKSSPCSPHIWQNELKPVKYSEKKLNATRLCIQL